MVEAVERRLAKLEAEMIEHRTRSEERWGETWRSKERVGTRLGDHEERIRALEEFKNTLVGKLAMASTVGAMIGGGLVTVLAKVLGG